MTHLEMRKIILQALEANDLDAVVSLALKSRKAMSLLVRLAYDKETLAGWRAIKAAGLVAKALAKTDHEFLRITVRKLLWSLSDESGGIGWSAPELLGEIVSSDPAGFADIVPLIAEVYDIEEETFRPGVVYALTRIAETSPELAACHQKIIIRSLVDKNSLMKIYALELVALLWNKVCRNNLWSLEYQEKVKRVVRVMANDTEVAWVYKNNAFTDIQVGELSKKIAKMLR